jgi:hypothetical protein
MIGEAMAGLTGSKVLANEDASTPRTDTELLRAKTKK